MGERAGASLWTFDRSWLLWAVQRPPPQLSGRIVAPANVARPPVVVQLGPAMPTNVSLNRFDPVAQFFASRGFATVRLHIRGTAGFGRTFREAGDLEHKGAMVRDLEDGIAWLAQQGWLDGERVALSGIHVGGLVALHAALTGRYKALLNLGTPMVVGNYDLAWLSSSDRDNDELTALAGGSAATHAYLKSLDPLAAAAKLTIPSFHFYQREPSGHEMTESGRLLKPVLTKAGRPAQFFLQPAPNGGDVDPAAVSAAVYEAAAEFLRKNL